MSDVLQFVWAVLSRWQAYITGGVVTALITIVEKKRGKAFSWRVFVWFLAVYLVVAFYLVWHDEHTELIRALAVNQSSKTADVKSKVVSLIRDLKEFQAERKEIESTVSGREAIPVGAERRHRSQPPSQQTRQPSMTCQQSTRVPVCCLCAANRTGATDLQKRQSQ